MSNMAGFANFDGSIPLHPAGHIKFFMSEPLKYTNPHIWAAYLFIMLGLGISALYLLFRRRNDLPNKGTKINTLNISLTREEEAFWRLKVKYDLLRERIASLDHDYDSGKLSLDDYREERNLHEQLLTNVKSQLEDYT